MVAVEVNRIEDEIRNLALTKRIRPSEFFLDYDRLRSGYVTETQFFRVLWDNLGLKFNEQQQAAISRKYDLKGDGRMNYRLFCDVINKPFNPNDLNKDPLSQQIEPLEFLGTVRSLRPLSANSEKRMAELLRSLHKFYQYHGINLRTCCEDFDRHHIGVIQESQFYRSFPRPPEVTEEDVAILVQKYRDPERPGLMNYLNLHHDIVAIGDRQMSPSGQPTVQQGVDITDYLDQQPGADPNLQQIFDKIRVAVFKNRVRTIEFFRDYDKLRSGVITENQFVCGLSLAIGKEAQLLRPEIQKVVEFYRLPDGRVGYKEFCDMMENAFNVPDLEKKPTLSVVRPPEGALGRNLKSLSETEEARVTEVLQQLSEQVKKRRLMMYQYFKDYDRSKSYSRVITPTQFGRILHFLSLNVAPEDLKLLCRKFADIATGDVNYPAFVQTVDREFVNYTQDLPVQEEFQSPDDCQTTAMDQLDTSSVDMDTLMARIRHHVLTNRLRVIEYFQDFDPLRSGSITKSQFSRGLSKLGLSALGKHTLSSPQLQVLSQHYTNPSMPDKVLWTKFMDDVESVFTQNNLEKNPTHQVPPSEVFLVPKPGTYDWNTAAPDHKDFLGQVLNRLALRASQRRVLMKPVFQDFDKHNNGHVTRGQFRQCLTMLELHCTEEEMKALEARFCNDTGFHYLDFLNQIQPEEKPQVMYVKRLEEIRMTNQKGNLPERNTTVADLESVLLKIKSKVCKERTRIHEWMKDYDKLRSGRMLKNNFRRALDLCKLELAESEIAILEDHYQTPGQADFVEYLLFSDDIESIFTTKNLEKAPLLEVEQFRPPEQWQQNVLAPEFEESIKKCMGRLAEKVRKNRMQLFPLFEDYDRVHNGTVSRSQFRRVLSELELASLVGTEQEWQLLWHKFDVKVGGKDDVNYIGFCDMIYELAKFEWRKP